MVKRTGPRSPYDDVLEKDFQQQIIAACQYQGWKVAHFRAARTKDSWITPVDADGKGWPDLFAVHPRGGDCFAAELKREREDATPEQLEWLAWFDLVQIDAYLWRPSDVDAALARIAIPQRRVRRPHG